MAGLRLSDAVGYIQRDGSLNMRVLLVTLWDCQDDPSLVEGLIDLLMERHASKEVVAGVELFMPQLLHLLLNLEGALSSDIMQEFCLMVCQVSLHFGLMMHWNLMGALHDCQPEFENEAKNPMFDEQKFKRCAALLDSLERAVVFGASPDKVTEIERNYSNSNIKKTELDRRLSTLRQTQARELVKYGRKEAAIIEGDLLFKRATRRTPLSTKGWKLKRFAIDHRMLMCYREAGGELERAVPLMYCTIEKREHRNKDFYFVVTETSSGRVFHLAADSEVTRAKWITELVRATEEPPAFKSADIVSTELTESQLSRFKWFRRELALASKLVNIAEELRRQDREDRAMMARRRMQMLNKWIKATDANVDLYNPLVRSADPFMKITSCLYDDVKVFNTKDRCPVLVSFETERPNLNEGEVDDVANHLHDKYGEVYPPTFRERVRAALAPVLSVSMTRASMWDEEDDVVSVTRTHVSSATGKSSMIVKSFDDLRQEELMMQLIHFMSEIWVEDAVPLWLLPYRIMPTSANSGIIELIEDSSSLHDIKHNYVVNERKKVTLLQHLKAGHKKAKDLAAARNRFAESLAAYSMICYIFGVKDRHNGNIMLRKDGRLIYIDWGFILGMAPGKDKVRGINASLERAPFKLTNEMVEVMGGVNSEAWYHFINLCHRGILTARAHKDTIIGMIKISSHRSTLPCFNQPGGVDRILSKLKRRLMLDVPDNKLEEKVKALVHRSRQHRGTVLYERFQKHSNNIQPLH